MKLSRSRLRLGIILPAVLLATAVMVGLVPGAAAPRASAGTPPTLLDDHRNSVGYLNLINLLSPLFDGPPLDLSLPETPGIPGQGIFLPPGPLITQDDQGPHSLANPQIVNLFYDPSWDADNPGAPSMEKIDQWTADLAGSSYFDAAGQYGVGSASFDGGFQANGGSDFFCGWDRSAAPAEVDLVQITQWVSCEAGIGRDITLGNPLTGVPGPNKNTLYVVYLPPNIGMSESNSCSKFANMHFFSAAWAAIFRFPVELFVAQPYPFAIIQTNCDTMSQGDLTGNPSVDWPSLQAGVTHEVIEAATNPFLTAGWFNDGTLTLSSDDFNGISAALTNLFSNGEAADICSKDVGSNNNVPVGTVGPPPDFLHPTEDITLPVTDPSVSNEITVAPYWSNADGRCVPDQSTMTTVTSSNSPSVYGQDVTFTATVATDPAGGTTPSGQVSFFDGTTLLGSASLDTNGDASFTTPGLAVGDHPDVTAQYQGQRGLFLASTSAAIDQTVQPALTVAALTSSADPSVFGQPVTLQATIFPGFPSISPPTQPTGTVQFYDGPTLLGTATLTQANPPTAAITTSMLAVGDHPDITAFYTGDSNFQASNASIDQVINQAPTSTQVSAVPNPSAWGQPVTFTAVVGPALAGSFPPVPPSGTVSFLVNGTAVATETLTPSGLNPTQAQASYTTSGLLPGTQEVTAVYSGDGNYQTSSSRAATQHVVCTSYATPTSGSLKASPTGSTCVVGIDVGGAVIAPPGSSIFISDSVVGAVHAKNAVMVGICSSTISGAADIRGATGFVVVGDPSDDGCAGNLIAGSLLFRDNSGDSEAWSNIIAGSLVLNGTSGTGPFPDDIQAELGSNTITGTFSCSGNVPPPVNDGQPNSAGGGTTGQCAGL